MSAIIRYDGKEIELLPGQFHAVQLHGPHMPGLKGAMTIDTYKSINDSIVNIELGIPANVELLNEDGSTARSLRADKVTLRTPGRGVRVISLAGDVEVWAK